MNEDDDRPDVDELQANARRHLWMHFSQLGQFREREIPIIMRGEGCYVWDQHGDRKLDGLSGLFTVQVGHGRRRLAHVAAKQAGTLEYFPLWSFAHPPAIELATKLAAGCARRPQPRLPHDRRIRRRRDLVEARAAVLPRDRPTAALQGHRAPHRVSRHDDGRPRPDRRTELPRAVRATHPRWSARDEHQLVPPSHGEGRARVHDAHHRRDRGSDPLRGTRDRCRRHARAGAERRWLHPTSRRATSNG